MTRDQTVLLGVLLGVGALVALCVVLLVALQGLRAATARTDRELDELRRRLRALEQQTPPPAAEVATRVPAEFVITGLGEPPSTTPERPDGPAFADIVLRETVVKAASLAHGVRRGLAPATRNRIRFEMKQEVRRARKQRRSDLKAAQHDLRARQRAALAADREAW